MPQRKRKASCLEAAPATTAAVDGDNGGSVPANRPRRNRRPAAAAAAAAIVPRRASARVAERDERARLQAEQEQEHERVRQEAESSMRGAAHFSASPSASAEFLLDQFKMAIDKGADIRDLLRALHCRGFDWNAHNVDGCTSLGTLFAWGRGGGWWNKGTNTFCVFLRHLDLTNTDLTRPILLDTTRTLWSCMTLPGVNDIRKTLLDVTPLDVLRQQLCAFEVIPRLCTNALTQPDNDQYKYEADVAFIDCLLARSVSEDYTINVNAVDGAYTTFDALTVLCAAPEGAPKLVTGREPVSQYLLTVFRSWHANATQFYATRHEALVERLRHIQGLVALTMSYVTLAPTPLSIRT
jgi:hypothetical protein